MILYKWFSLIFIQFLLSIKYFDQVADQISSDATAVFVSRITKNVTELMIVAMAVTNLIAQHPLTYDRVCWFFLFTGMLHFCTDFCYSKIINTGLEYCMELQKSWKQPSRFDGVLRNIAKINFCVQWREYRKEKIKFLIIF